MRTSPVSSCDLARRAPTGRADNALHDPYLVDDWMVADAVKAGEFAGSGVQAGLQALDLAEPLVDPGFLDPGFLDPGFLDPVFQVVDDHHQAWPGRRVDSQAWAV